MKVTQRGDPALIGCSIGGLGKEGCVTGKGVLKEALAIGEGSI